MSAVAKAQVLDEEGIDRSLMRVAHEIADLYGSCEDVALIGIRTRGEFIATRLASKLREISGRKIPVGFLDVTFYRDDFRERLIQPQIKGTDIPFSIDGMSLILADDVLFTGRTIRAALSEIMDFGRAARVSVAVLVDRGHREMPIKADFVGKNIPTADNEHVLVRMNEVDGRDEVYLVEYK
ncbi:MAG: bifunctional pyr operon transcriptional regulator/uracil phosphoribosyltransferase PyrR [Candidatus Neomarinimicrobiota bacterium]